MPENNLGIFANAVLDGDVKEIYGVALCWAAECCAQEPGEHTRLNVSMQNALGVRDESTVKYLKQLFESIM